MNVSENGLLNTLDFLLVVGTSDQPELDAKQMTLQQGKSVKYILTQTTISARNHRELVWVHAARGVGPCQNAPSDTAVPGAKII